jgi:hypothetical protein
MQHFKNIYILAMLRMDNDEELYIGHVAPEGFIFHGNISCLVILITLII